MPRSKREKYILHFINSREHKLKHFATSGKSIGKNQATHLQIIYVAFFANAGQSLCENEGNNFIMLINAMQSKERLMPLLYLLHFDQIHQAVELHNFVLSQAKLQSIWNQKSHNYLFQSH